MNYNCGGVDNYHGRRDNDFGSGGAQFRDKTICALGDVWASARGKYKYTIKRTPVRLNIPEKLRLFVARSGPRNSL